MTTQGPTGPGWVYSPEVLSKAAQYLATGHVEADVAGVYWVQGSGAKKYRVQTDADALTRRATWITCTCPHGGHVGMGSARCSHAVAVLLAVRDRTPLPCLDLGDLTLGGMSRWT